MSDFKAKMHQIDFGWALSQAPLGVYNSLLDRTDPLAGIKGTYF